jgi:hypothetical protein
MTSNHHGWSHRGLLLHPFALHCLRTAIVEPSSGCRRPANALEPGNERGWPDPDTTRAEPQHIELTRQVARRIVSSQQPTHCAASATVMNCSTRVPDRRRRFTCTGSSETISRPSARRRRRCATARASRASWSRSFATSSAVAVWLAASRAFAARPAASIDSSPSRARAAASVRGAPVAAWRNAQRISPIMSSPMCRFVSGC